MPDYLTPACPRQSIQLAGSLLVMPVAVDQAILVKTISLPQHQCSMYMSVPMQHTHVSLNAAHTCQYQCSTHMSVPMQHTHVSLNVASCTCQYQLSTQMSAATLFNRTVCMCNLYTELNYALHCTNGSENNVSALPSLFLVVLYTCQCSGPAVHSHLLWLSCTSPSLR